MQPDGGLLLLLATAAASGIGATAARIAARAAIVAVGA
jgi:hypothetical protein